MPGDRIMKNQTSRDRIDETAIILAGGLGTRLRAAVPDLPKCMAPVSGKPFLFYVITFLQKEGIKRFIFCLGYMHESIEHYLKENFPALDYTISLEEEPLGTGGAIKLACNQIKEKDALVFNGDTFFEIDVRELLSFHKTNDSACTLALKLMHDFERYGVVGINNAGRIQSFKEKQFYQSGLINGGIYALNVPEFLEMDLPLKFSFEKDYLEVYYTTTPMMGIVQDKYFIDIGIPGDLLKANKDL